MSSQRYLASALILGFILGCNFIYAEEASVETPLRIEAKSNLRDQQSGGVIFSLTNVSKKAIKIDENATPWGEPSSILLIGIDKKGGKILRQLGWPLEHNFLTKHIVLEPNETITGIISLHTHFGNIERLRKKGGLLVFWHYRAIGQSGEELGEYGGWLNISK